MIALFSYQFFVTAFVCGAAISLCAALVGTHLTLKHFSMLGDGLSHVGFGALALAAAWNLAPLSIAIPAVLICAFLLLRLQKSAQSASGADAAVAMLSAAALAVGVIAVSLSGTTVDLDGYLFGSILAISASETPLVLGVCALVALTYVCCFPRLFAVTFDKDFARACGTRVGLYDTVLSLLCALVVVLGMRIAGALLISALLIFPPKAAMKLTRSFRATVILSAVFSLVFFTAGLIGSWYLDLPAGAAVVAANALGFCLCALFGVLIRKKKK